MVYLVFIVGLIFGSFLNVVIYRLNPAPRQAQGGVFGRSFCPNCKEQLNWYDLIPVLSFILLKGRCRYCRKKISWQYPAVELMSGILWVLVFYKVFGRLGFETAQAGISDFGFRIFDTVYYIFILSALLIIAVYDFKWKIIPDKIVYPAITVALTYNFFKSFIPAGHFPKGENFEVFILPLFIALIAFLFFFAIFYFSRGRAMGLGDAKLAFLIGLLLTPLSAAIAFTLAFVVGAACGIILLIAGGVSSYSSLYGRWNLKSQIAFGPFLVFGAFIVFFFSDFIIKSLNLLNS